MADPLRSLREISESPVQFLAGVGETFAVFGPATQDSGNLSYGIRIGDERYFVKTTDPDADVYLDFSDRVALLRNAVTLNGRCRHRLLPPLVNVIESTAGPMLVYRWVDGELLRAAKGDEDSAHERFRRLPASRISAALAELFDLHTALAALGYVAADFYDGCLIYDFAAGRLHVVDLDHYQLGPFANEMGRMFGSTRFMAPEELTLGAQVDEATTVFNLGRAAALFLGDGSLDVDRFRGGAEFFAVTARACEVDKAQRFQSVAELGQAWQAALGQAPETMK